MRRRILHAPHPFGDINVTPLIDVVMCMIVFYLIVGKLAADQRSQMRLPESRTGSTDRAQDLLVINVVPEAAGSTIVVDRVEVAPLELSELVRLRLAAKPGLIVQIRAGRELRYAAVEPVVRACRNAGIPSVRLATERTP